MPLLPSCNCGRYISEYALKYEKLDNQLKVDKKSDKEIKRIIFDELEKEDIRLCCKMKIRFYINTDIYNL